jgi:hypothetical protein
MTSKDFVQAIRRIIQEEVQKTVRKEIQVVLNENKSNFIDTSIHDSFVPGLKTKTKQSKQPKAYSKNPMLNDLLNETSPMRGDGNYIAESFAGSSIDYNDFNEWPSMKNMSSMMSNRGSVSNMIPTTDTEGRPIQNAHVPEEVANALTRDYSSLMKAINKKKGG